mgnify:CR=1 FL=1
MSGVDWRHPAEDPAPTPALGARPAEPVAAVLALGANLREPAQTLDAAVAALSALPHVTDVQASSRAVTAPVGGPPGQPDYLNQVVTLRTDLAPWELLAVAHRLEQEHHRRREVRWGARTLDVDVIAYGDVRSDHPALTLPHPRAAERASTMGWDRTADELLEVVGQRTDQAADPGAHVGRRTELGQRYPSPNGSLVARSLMMSSRPALWRAPGTINEWLTPGRFAAIQAFFDSR